MATLLSKSNVKIRRTKSPAELVLDKLGDISQLQLRLNWVLLANDVWQEDDKGESLSEHGIIIPNFAHGTKREHEIQSKAGLVVAMGPQCFRDDDEYKFMEQDKFKLGDWVWADVANGRAVSIKGVYCRLYRDTAIYGKIPDPDYVF